MVPFGSRRGAAGSRTLPLMILSFLVAGGFFTWLYFQAAPVEVQVVEGPVDDEQVARIITIEDFAANPMAYEGLVIQVRGLGVRSRPGAAGSEVFFVGLPPATEYLVRMLPEVAADGVVVEARATVAVTGTVYTMSDSVADSWVASGGIAEGDRIQAIFATSFLEARAVSVTAQAPPQP